MNPTPAAALAAWQAACAAAGAPARTPTETVAVTDSVGRVSAEPVLAARPCPGYAAAAMDGIAVAAVETLDAPTALRPDRFVVVDTGDPVPDGFDAVVMREHLKYAADGTAELTRPVKAGHHVRPVGEDVRAGELLLAAGQRIRPVDAAVAAAAGVHRLTVHQVPTVAVIPTGDEVRPIGTDPAPGEVIDTNSLMLAGFAAEACVRAIVLPIVPDDPAVLTQALQSAAWTADLVLMIAGAGKGRDDWTSTVVSAVGSVVVQGVAVRPGHPVLLGVVDDPPTPVLGVPGYPVSAALSFDLFAAPLLAALTGTAVPIRPRVLARLAGPVRSSQACEDWVRVSLERLDGELIATPLARGAGVLSSLVRADGLLAVPAGLGDLETGEQVTVELLRTPPEPG